MNRPTDFHDSLRRLLATSSRDWGRERADAWIWGIVHGWDTDPEDLVEGFEDEDAMSELAALHGWDDAEVARLRQLHAQFVAAASLEHGEPRPEPDQQTWERRIPGTDVPLTRIHLTIAPDGRAPVHEALLAQLLVDAGWERAQ